MARKKTAAEVAFNFVNEIYTLFRNVGVQYGWLSSVPSASSRVNKKAEDVTVYEKINSNISRTAITRPV